MTSIRSKTAVRNPRQANQFSLNAGFFMPVRNSLHDGKAVICGRGYGVEERNKGLINPNTHPDKHDRRKPAVLHLIETITVTSNNGFINRKTETVMSKQLTADFHGTSLNIVEHKSQPFVSAKQIAAAIGLNWQPQHAKLTSNRDRWGITMIVIPSVSGNQDTLCIPLRKLPGWLMTIQSNRVSETIRPRIVQYQNECDDVLWEHWEKQQTPAAAAQTVGTPANALSLSPIDTSIVNQETVQTIISMIAAYQQKQAKCLITVALVPECEPVIKAMDGGLTVFPNESIKSFVAHYDKATELSVSNVSAMNGFLRSGSFIEDKSEGDLS